MRKHLSILCFGLLCLVVGLGLQTAGVAAPDWFKSTNNTNNAIIVISLWNRCQEGPALKTPPENCNKGKVLLFGKDDFKLDLILSLHCGSILICLVGLIAVLSMFYCRNQRNAWGQCSMITSTIISISAASGVAAVVYNEYNHKEHYRNSYLRGWAYMMAICGVCMISISEVLLVVLIFIKPKKTIIYAQSKRMESNKYNEVELK